MVCLWDEHKRGCNEDFKDALKLISDAQLFRDAGLKENEMNLEKSQEALHIFKAMKLFKDALGKPYLEHNGSPIISKPSSESGPDCQKRGMTIREKFFVAR